MEKQDPYHVQMFAQSGDEMSMYVENAESDVHASNIAIAAFGLSEAPRSIRVKKLIRADDAHKGDTGSSDISTFAPV